MAAFTLPCLRSALPLERVRVLPFEVVAESFPEAPAREDEAPLLARLRTQANDWAVRALKVNGVAREAVVSTEASGDTSYTLQGRLHLPVALPPHLIGFDAWNRRGRFMSGEVDLRDASGAAVAHRAFQLVWGDGQWLTGARAKHNAPLDDVLMAYVRKSVDRVVLGVKREIQAQNRRL